MKNGRDLEHHVCILSSFYAYLQCRFLPVLSMSFYFAQYGSNSSLVPLGRHVASLCSLLSDHSYATCFSTLATTYSVSDPLILHVDLSIAHWITRTFLLLIENSSLRYFGGLIFLYIPVFCGPNRCIQFTNFYEMFWLGPIYNSKCAKFEQDWFTNN